MRECGGASCGFRVAFPYLELCMSQGGKIVRCSDAMQCREEESVQCSDAVQYDSAWNVAMCVAKRATSRVYLLAANAHSSQCIENTQRKRTGSSTARRWQISWQRMARSLTCKATWWLAPPHCHELNMISEASHCQNVTAIISVSLPAALIGFPSTCTKYLDLSSGLR
jgi:hypothetical protein